MNRDFRSWHRTDMPTALRDVRFQGQSGKHMLTLSFSGFDPKATSAAPSDNDYPVASLQQTRDSNVHHHSGRHPRDVRLRRFNCRGRSISGPTRPLSNGAEIADMKKPTLRIEEQQPRNIQRADIAPLSESAIVVDGHFKDLRRGLPRW